MNEHIIHLMEFLISVSSERYTVSFDYSGIGNCFSVRSYAGEWHLGKDFSIYIEGVSLELMTAVTCESIKAEILADMKKVARND